MKVVCKHNLFTSSAGQVGGGEGGLLMHMILFTILLCTGNHIKTKKNIAPPPAYQMGYSLPTLCFFDSFVIFCESTINRMSFSDCLTDSAQT